MGMFDIISCSANPEEFGFRMLHNYDAVKDRIKKVKDLADAVRYRNHRVLVLLSDYTVDDGAAKLLGEKGAACILINLSDVIAARGIRKAIEISRMRSFISCALRNGVVCALMSLAPDVQSIRTPRELIHIACLLDVKPDDAKRMLRVLGSYL